MKLTQLPSLDLELNKPTLGYVRTPGLHMSEIYGSLYKKLDARRYDKPETAHSNAAKAVRMEVGTAFEEVLEEALASRIFGERPGEFVSRHAKDCTRYRSHVAVGDTPCRCGAGVIFSPDYLITEDDGSIRLGEFKCTWMSIRHGIQDARFDKWFCQMKAYCYHLRLRQARLYAMFINGDYSFKPPAGDPHIPNPWNIEFSQKELDANWHVLLRHALKEKMIA